MGKFADALFTDLMREHGPALEQWDRQPAQDRREGRRPAPPLAIRPEPRPPRRRDAWLAPVAAAAGVTVAVGLAAVLGSRVHLGGQAGHANAGGRADTAYVFNGYNGTLTPISPVTGRLGKPVTVGPGAHQITIGGHHIMVPSIWQDTILPDGRTAYVSYPGKGGITLLTRVSLVTGAAGKPINLGRRTEQIVVMPDGRTAYVTYQDPRHLHGPGLLRPVSLRTGIVGVPILSHRGPLGEIALTPDGKTLYVLGGSAGTVTPVTTATNTPGTPIPVPGARLITFTPDGRTAFVRSFLTTRRVRQTVTPISTATNTPGRAINIGRGGITLAYAPDGTTIYVVHTGTSVLPIPVSTGTAGNPIKVPGAGNMAITPDGSTGYLVNVSYSSVTPVSLATNTVGKPLHVPGFPRHIVMTPNGRNAYAYSDSTRDTQTVIPISTATGTPGKPITIAARGIEVLIPGEQP